jgi:hypothetical protein
MRRNDDYDAAAATAANGGDALLDLDARGWEDWGCRFIMIIFPSRCRQESRQELLYLFISHSLALSIDAYDILLFYYSLSKVLAPSAHTAVQSKVNRYWLSRWMEMNKK